MASPIFTCDFNDATIIDDVTDTLGFDDPSQETGTGAITLEETIIPRVGTKSVKCVAPAYSPGAMSRAALQKAAFDFDAFTETWIEWYFYLASAASYHMLGLLDIEDSDHPTGLVPGVSIYMTSDRMLHAALLRAGNAEVVSQVSTANNPIEDGMPVDQWVKLRAYLYFDADLQTGRVKVWRDDELILDAAARTMPTGMYVTDRIQLGITNHEGAVEQTVYIADVKVWNAEPDDGASPPGTGPSKDRPRPELE